MLENMVVSLMLALSMVMGQVSAALTPAIELTPIDEYETYYSFTYGDEEFVAYYEPDCWKIYDSYRITDKNAMVAICQALLNEHVVHKSDGESIRTAEDMALEWQQHNVAYACTSEESSLHERARHVDFDSEEQAQDLF